MLLNGSNDRGVNSRTGKIEEIGLTKAVSGERKSQGRQRTAEQADLRRIGRAREGIDGLKLVHALMLVRSIDIATLAWHLY